MTDNTVPTPDVTPELDVATPVAKAAKKTTTTAKKK